MTLGPPLRSSDRPWSARVAAAIAAVLIFPVIGLPQTGVPAPPDVASPPPQAETKPSGLATRVLSPGTGSDHPTKDDVVVVHYTGWTTDGKMFDTNTSGKPATFAVKAVIAGVSEALQLMVTGEKRRAWIPEPLAYKGRREPKGMLVFDLELIDIPSHPPSDVKAAPGDAVRTSSGLAYKILQEGLGARRPRSTSSVTVQYTGWTTDGKMFDSSLVRGQAATLGLDSVIPGWSEGIQLMVEGEKMRLWIPEKLAYLGKSAPYGMLVFDVELIKINQ